MSEDQGAVKPKELPLPEELTVEVLGPASVDSPLTQRNQEFTKDSEGVLVVSERRQTRNILREGREIPAFESARPRARIFCEPSRLSCGIVTCGGFCPGLNDVIRSIVLTLRNGYGVNRVLGFRYGYAGLSTQKYLDPIFLEPGMLRTAHQQGGTLLGSSRGPQDLGDMIDTLVRWKVNILFAVGGSA